MAKYRIVVASHIPTPAERVYAIIADYRDGHPHILPKPYFVSLSVDQGGVGAGTVITFQMRVMGQLRTFHAAITEPEPGRVVETDLYVGTVTTFTVEPRDGGQHAHVTITTDLRVRDGVLGGLEGWLTARCSAPSTSRNWINSPPLRIGASDHDAFDRISQGH